MKLGKRMMVVVGTVLLLSPVLLAEIRDEVRNTFQVAQGGTLHLESDMGSLEVRSSEANIVEVVVIQKVRSDDPRDFEEALRMLDLDIRQEGNDVVIAADYDGSNRRRDHHLNLEFRILVPYRYNIDARTAGGSVSVEDLEGEVRVQTAGGSLTFGRIVGNVVGRTAGGSVTLEGSSGTADIETAGGSISIGEVEADVIAHTAGGSISVKEVYGSINATTSGGSITASILSQPSGDCRLTTSGGTVSVSLARSIGLDLDAETGNGRVISDFGQVDTSTRKAQRRLKTQVSGGGPQLLLRTSGGNIRITEIER